MFRPEEKDGDEVSQGQGQGLTRVRPRVKVKQEQGEKSEDTQQALRHRQLPQPRSRDPVFTSVYRPPRRR